MPWGVQVVSTGWCLFLSQGSSTRREKYLLKRAVEVLRDPTVQLLMLELIIKQ